MRTFVSTDNVTFMFPGVESGLVGTLQVPSIDSILEFAAYVQEERAAIKRGPRLLGKGQRWGTLLMNAANLKVEYDTTLPKGAIHYADGEGRVVLMEGDGPRTSPDPSDGAGGVGAGGGDEGR